MSRFQGSKSTYLYYVLMAIFTSEGARSKIHMAHGVQDKTPSDFLKHTSSPAKDFGQPGK